MIKLDNVQFRYPNGVHALRGVDLELDSGCICILGHNGAGKTTLFRHLNGLLKPTEGSVNVFGNSTNKLRTAKLARYVALAFQNPDSQLFKETVADEVEFGAIHGCRENGTTDELVAWAVEIMELCGLEEKNPYDLLLGERKRVAVASVAAMDTPAVVLDEPTGGQDAKGVMIMSRLVGELRSRGKIVIVSTHDVEFAWNHADRIVIMNQGTVISSGDPPTVFSQAELLAEAGVKPPAVTQIALAAGASKGVATTDELVAWLKRVQ